MLCSLRTASVEERSVAMMEGRRGREAPVAAEHLDAVIAETPAEGPRRRTGGQKRKVASSLSAAVVSASTSKRLVKERNALNILSSGHNGPCTRARQLPGKIAAGSPQTPQEGLAMVETVVAEVGKEIVFFEDPIKSVECSVEPPDVTTMEAMFEAVRSRGVRVHVVPTSAGWFSWEKIHELEKHALPSFFNGQSESRTPEIYLEIRNAIMKKFHVDPQTPVEVKDLSEISAGELGVRQEVMEFLDHWGLINFHPFPHSISDTSAPEVGAEKTASLLDQLYQFENAESLSSYVPKKQESSPPSMLPQLLPESALLDDMMRPVDPSVEYHCNSCSGDCSRRRYHCQKQADFDLCAECYNNGMFGSGMTPADFILMESADGPGVSSRNWTDQETLLLLEALELFGENWNEIAEHVATKTKAQCILHFLQMPIEDPFLEIKENDDDNMVERVEPSSANMESPEAMELENGMSSEQPVSSPADVSDRKNAEVDLSSETYSNFAINSLRRAFQAVSFTDDEGRLLSFVEAGNPVMVLAAFLAGLVDQDVVSTSSHSSLKSISEESPGTQLVSRHCFILEEPPNEASSPLVPESSVNAIDDTEASKEEEQLPSSNGSAELKNGAMNIQPDAASGQCEVKQSASSNDIQPKSSAEKELNDSIAPLDVTSHSIEADDKPLLEEQSLRFNGNDESNFDEAMVNKTSNLKEPGQVGDTPSMLMSVDNLKGSEGKPEFAEQSGNSELIDQVQQISEFPKVEDTTPTSIVLKEEPEQKDGAASTLDVNVMAGHGSSCWGQKMWQQQLQDPGGMDNSSNDFGIWIKGPPAIGMKTPLGMWYGKPGNYEVFGCIAYAHVKQDKLEARALKCIFIGYPFETKCYKLWCLDQQKSIISRDVVFDKSKMANLQSYITKNSATKEDTPFEVELQQQQILTDQRTDVNNQGEVVEDQQETEPENRSNDYSLVRDRQRRTIRPPERCGHADLISYALSVAEERPVESEDESYVGVAKRCRSLARPDGVVGRQDRERKERDSEQGSQIILSLGDKVLREVSRETTAQALWAKLKLLYMTKSLVNRLFLKQRMYSFKMHEEKSVSKQINKIIDDLENIDVKMDDEDKTLLLLNSIPKSYEHFKDVMLYGRTQTIFLEDAQSLIIAKELQKKHEMNEEIGGDNLTIRGRSHKNGSRNSQSRSRNNCLERKKVFQEKPKDPGEASIASDSYDSAEALVITESESNKEWILDSGCSFHMFHMCHHKDWFETLQLENGGSALLGDNKFLNKEEYKKSPYGLILSSSGNGDDKKTSSPKNDISTATTDSSHSVNSIKRATVTVLSAAAVKAKLHADHEEDQIRQLVSCLIEKQLRKMEIKLAFFPEMENLIIRAKEQTERARQKLYSERSQIIAARLGLAQSSRSYATHSANAKLAMGYGNMIIRPPSMAYQKPPPPRRP
ncbi:SWI/SNF complex subunit SWI3D [Phalaenopsis equestris]|uniref:SWI/SNF complex subunit SWI3D n=1 Tax=Phalaenopsis equestris TaxID=78828 RepID=UPI0009E2F008|nr:SWI/SNF complex subunit SWI3D [Phalaenopsis equestris]